MWLTIALRNSLAATSLPIPLSGVAVSLAITVSSCLPCRTISSMTPLGRANAHESADHQVAPFGIIRPIDRGKLSS